MRRPFLVMILIPVLVLAGCNAAGGGTKGTGGTIEGIHWVLTTIDIQGESKPIPDVVTIDATFAGGTVNGSGGCNSYRGSYTVDGAKLRAGPFSSTSKACPDPAGALETGYLASLAAADSYTATADTLTIYDIPGTALLVYKAGPANPLVGSWIVTGYNNGNEAVVSPAAGTELTAVFGEDGSLSGNSGCNTYNGTYTLEGEALTVGPLATTKMACEEPAMSQETQFLAALGGATGYRVEGANITLTSADGSNAVTLGPAS